jgi:hypothetical protein
MLRSMKQETRAHMLSLLKKDREHHLNAIQEIDAILERIGAEAAPAKRGPGRPRGSKNKKKKTKAKGAKKASKKSGKKRTRKGRGIKPGGSRVQGVKQTLADALTSSPQSPADLQTKVSNKLGHKVSIATQLHMLKRDGVAKAVGRGQWVKA